MKNIIVLAPFVTLPNEPYFDRFLYLCYLWSKEFNVTLITSRFCHFNKSHRVPNVKELTDLPFNLVLLDEPGYKKNVSFDRIYSHYIFQKCFQKWVKKEHKFMSNIDVVYSAFPLIVTNLIIGKLKHIFGYKMIIDIQDIWPDSIFSAIPFLKRIDFFLMPLRSKAYKAYSYADGIVAVSNTYLELALKQCPDTPGLSVYLGADYELIESVEARQLDTSKIRLVYIGTLSHSYDLETVIEGFIDVRTNIQNVELHILGDGPKRSQLEKKAGDGIFFHGYMPYEKMIAFVKSCDIAINPFVSSAMQSITNKLSDYIALGLPILSSQKSEEASNIIERSGGYLFQSNPTSFASLARQMIVHTQSKRKEELKDNKLLFDRRVTYPQITKFLEEICRSPNQ